MLLSDVNEGFNHEINRKDNFMIQVLSSYLKILVFFLSL